MVQAIVFDLDNTLLDFLGTKLSCCEQAAAAMLECGLLVNFPEEELPKRLFQAYMEDLEGDRVFEAFVKEHHKGRLGSGRHQTTRIVAAGVNAYLQTKFSMLRTYQGVRETLLEIIRRGYRVGVLTDAPRFKAYQRIHLAGLDGFFPIILTPDDHGFHKPNAGAFRAICNALDLPPHEVLMVGDSIGRDIKGALDAGMKVAWAEYGSDEFVDESGLVPIRLGRFSDLLKHV